MAYTHSSGEAALLLKVPQRPKGLQLILIDIAPLGYSLARLSTPIYASKLFFFKYFFFFSPFLLYNSQTTFEFSSALCFHQHPSYHRQSQIFIQTFLRFLFQCLSYPSTCTPSACSFIQYFNGISYPGNSLLLLISLSKYSSLYILQCGQSFIAPVESEQLFLTHSDR